MLIFDAAHERYRYNYDVDRMIKAYEASRASFDDEIERVNSFIVAHKEHGDDDEAARDYADMLGDEHLDATLTLRLVREAYVLTFYHLWEKYALRWMDKKRYDSLLDPQSLQDRGIIVDPEIDRMRLTANLIKHRSGALFQKYPDMLEPIARKYIAGGLEPDLYDYLQLTDQDMNLFIDAMKRSGPNAAPKLSI